MLLALNIFGKGVGADMFPLWLFLLHCSEQKLITCGFLCLLLSKHLTRNKKNNNFTVLFTLSVLQII